MIFINKLYRSTLRLGTTSAFCAIIIRYHDFLPLPKWGSHVKTDSTHTIINIHPLAHLFDIHALIFGSCALFTDYPNRIM